MNAFQHGLCIFSSIIDNALFIWGLTEFYIKQFYQSCTPGNLTRSKKNTKTTFPGLLPKKWKLIQHICYYTIPNSKRAALLSNEHTFIGGNCHQNKIFNCPGQLNRSSCHSVIKSVSDSSFDFRLQGLQ